MVYEAPAVPAMSSTATLQHPPKRPPESLPGLEDCPYPKTVTSSSYRGSQKQGMFLGVSRIRIRDFYIVSLLGLPDFGKLPNEYRLIFSEAEPDAS